MATPLLPYLVRNYTEVKRHYPAEGRRGWRLRVAQQLWTALHSGDSGLLSPPWDDSQDVLPKATSTANFVTDPDPLDGVASQGPQLGLILRTDFSDDATWAAFCARVQDSEKEFIAESDDVQEDAPRGDNVDELDGSDSTSEEEEAPPAIFHIISPTCPQERALLANVSNLTALRLFNDVDVRPAPSPPQGAKRINPPNRLVDYHGWQEFYQGKNLWIYDSKSNIDQCVRVVSQSADMYGTATGDSWRARVSHICELQVHLSSGVLKIDFGGLDRWDFDERQRNMMEAERE